jgi:hypothetical protein
MSKSFPEKYSKRYIKQIMNPMEQGEYFEKCFLLHPPKCDVIDPNGIQCSNIGRHEMGRGKLLCNYHYNELLQIEERHKQEKKDIGR